MVRISVILPIIIVRWKVLNLKMTTEFLNWNSEKQEKEETLRNVWFQDELCPVYVMDTKSDGVENLQEVNRIASTLGDQGEEADIEEGAVSEDEEYDMPPTPDTVPMANSTAIEESCDQIDGQPGNSEQSNGNLAANEPVKRRRTTEEVASFNT